MNAPWWQQYGSLLDLYIIISCSVLAVVLSRRGHFHRFGTMIVVLILALDLLTYRRAVPLNHSLLIPVEGWWSSDSIGLGGLVSILLLIVFSLFLIRALRKRRVVPTSVLVFLVLFCLGFRPAWMQMKHFSTSLIPVESVDPAALEDIRTRTAPHVLEARANVDDSRAAPPIFVKKGQLVVLALEHEVPFFFRNAREYQAAREDPNFVRGTFDHPCGMNSGYMIRTSPRAYPIDPRFRPLPMSTTLVHVDGYAYQPIDSRIEVFQATKSGEIKIAYNFPQGYPHGYANDTADGMRAFQIWVIDRVSLEGG